MSSRAQFREAISQPGIYSRAHLREAISQPGISSRAHLHEAISQYKNAAAGASPPLESGHTRPDPEAGRTSRQVSEYYWENTIKEILIPGRSPGIHIHHPDLHSHLASHSNS